MQKEQTREADKQKIDERMEAFLGKNPSIREALRALDISDEQYRRMLEDQQRGSSSTHTTSYAPEQNVKLFGIGPLS